MTNSSPQFRQRADRLNRGPARIHDHRKTKGEGVALDDFPTPLWATRALCELVEEWAPREWKAILNERRCWEPAANRGAMSRPLAEYGFEVIESDLAAGSEHGSYGRDDLPLYDFVTGSQPLGAPLWTPPRKGEIDAVITNPPFSAADDFICRGLDLAPVVAILGRTQLLEGSRRWDRVFSKTPPDFIYVFIRRLAFWPGRLNREAASMMSFSWFVWAGGNGQMRVRGIPKETQKRLERADDWDAPPERK